MNKYYFIFLIWLLPLYFLVQNGYQVATYFGIESTYHDGDSYMADVVDFDVKQIAAQTNGYVILHFSTDDGTEVEQQLALPVQMAQVIMESELIPVRYRENSFRPIVMMPTYELQQSVVKVNLAVTGFGVIVTILIAFYASRYAIRRIRYGEDVLEIERLDPENTN